MVVTRPEECGLLGERPRRRDRPCDIGKEAVERFRCVVDRCPVDADQNIEHLADVDDANAAVPSVERGRDLPRGPVVDQNADDGPGVDDYSP